jgi:thiamine-monophosphate kinase
MPHRGGRARFKERSFHRWLAGRFGADPGVAVGGHRVALLTTDAFVEGVHFLPRSPPRAVGAAVVGASLSDLAAKGAAPAALLLDVLVPPSTPEAWARALVLGAARRLTAFGARLVGGDTKPSATRTVVGTLLGWGDDRYLAPRSAAWAGDLLVTTGTVGRGAIAARRLPAGRRGSARAMEELLRIEPRVVEGRLLAQRAHAMLDTSDGLAESAHLLAEASRVRVALDAERLPLARGLSRPGSRGGTEAFFGGDYELLAAIAPKDFAPLRRALAGVGTALTIVGRVERGRGAILRAEGGAFALPRAGWDPFGEHTS